MSKHTKVQSKPRGTERDTSHRLGFMQGEFAIPDDFDKMGKDQITDLFEAVSISTRCYQFNRKDSNKR